MGNYAHRKKKQSNQSNKSTRTLLHKPCPSTSPPKKVHHTQMIAFLPFYFLAAARPGRSEPFGESNITTKPQPFYRPHAQAAAAAANITPAADNRRLSSARVAAADRMALCTASARV